VNGCIKWREFDVPKISRLIVTLLLIEWLDEIVGGALGAAWPLIRADLNLSYTQIGLLATLPELVALCIEPVLGLMAVGHRRRSLIRTGGVCFAIAVMLMAMSQSYPMLLLAYMLAYPASGAFVNTSQATLMDSNPARHDVNMARWVLAGSVGVLSGQLGLSVVLALGGSWRWMLAAIAGLMLIVTVTLPKWRSRAEHSEESLPWRQRVHHLWMALQKPVVLRWVVLLQCTDLMLDIFAGFVALYFVDVVGVSASTAGLAIGLWTGVGLLGDALLIPLLARVNSLVYLRCSALIVAILFPAFLLLPGLVSKLIVISLLGLLNAGWYSILQGQLYSAMPGQSHLVMTISSMSSWVSGLMPLGLGIVSDRAGLSVAMWLLWAAPLALLVGLSQQTVTHSEQ
jgi:MFS transporter, FSR family, fosmidomycin resistance protein